MPLPDPAPQHGRRTPRRFVFSVHGNSMARASDRTEAALIVLLVIFWVLCLPIAAADGTPLGGTSSVRARWSGTNGLEETGEIQAPAGLTSGTKVQIWLDQSG